MLPKSKYEDSQDHLPTEAQFKVLVDVRKFLAHVMHVRLWEEKGEIIQFMRIIMTYHISMVALLFKTYYVSMHLQQSSKYILKNRGKLLCMHLQCMMGLSPT
jgi:hypothetical protein